MSEENKTKNVKKKIWIILVVVLIFLASCSALVFKSAGFQRFKKNVKKAEDIVLQLKIMNLHSSSQTSTELLTMSK